MIGRQSQQDQIEEQQENEFERRLHSSNVAQMPAPDDDDKAAEILRILSNIDDLSIGPGDDKILGQLVSKLTSTANLTPDQVRSNEWVREYLLVLYLSKHPKADGVHGGWRGWAHADHSEALDPLDTAERMEIESFIQEGKLALTRSEDAKVIEESTHTVHESVIHDDRDGGGGGGILGRLKG